MKKKNARKLAIKVTRTSLGGTSNGKEETAGDEGKQYFHIDPSEIDTFEFQTNDELAVVPEEAAASLHKTPDGSRHVPAPNGGSYRIPSVMELYEYKGYTIPEHLILLTGAGGKTLDSIGRAHITLYNKFLGLEPDMSVLEIGCGIGRDAMQFEECIGPEGRYVGIDVTRDAIAWCQNNIGRKNANFLFSHFDAENEVYNPLGSKTSLDVVLPVDSGSIDRVVLGSVFTHLYEEEIRHYLKEISRVLKPSGRSYATFFLYSDETIAASRDNSLTPFNLRFEHAESPGLYINDPQYPRGAVAITEDLMNDMIAAAGLRLERPFLKGMWSGAFKDPDEGQEAVVLALA